MFSSMLGVAMIVFAVVVRWSSANEMRTQESPIVAWRYLALSPTLWLGVAVAIDAIEPRAAAVLFAVIAGVASVVVLRMLTQLVRGVISFPDACRRIGQPSAWRGKPRLD